MAEQKQTQLLKTYTCTVFESHFPRGPAALVRAYSSEEAANKLNNWLRKTRLSSKTGLPNDASPANMKR